MLDATTNPATNSSSEIVLVISNNDKASGLERARQANIPVKVYIFCSFFNANFFSSNQVVKHTDFGSRVDFDMAVNEALVDAHIDLVCLAGFMRVLSAEFVQLWCGRLINIHPALLPSFRGTHAHRQALEAGVRVTGCTVHFVEVRELFSSLFYVIFFS